nr:DUF2829 domain-containing protein [uncultured Draconibacterium sp.]
MKKYLGVKIIDAEPMWVEAAEKHLGRPISASSDADGYLVKNEDGYESWSPKEVFEKAYRRIDNLTFGLAVEALKQGKKVARAGWNEKGMWLALSVNAGECYDDISKNGEQKGSYEMLSWIGMKTADNKFVPWLASQTDILSEDWTIIE